MREPPLPPSMSGGNRAIHGGFIHSIGNFEPTNEEFLDQMLSSDVLPSNPWAVDIDPTSMVGGDGCFDDRARTHLQQRQASCGGSNDLMMLQHHHQQLLGVNNGSSMSILNSDLNDDDGSLFVNRGNDASMKAFLDGFAGRIGQTHSQPQQFPHNQGQSFGAEVSGQSGGGGVARPKQQRVRARRGQATDPHSIAERLRRERIAERMKSLQELLPNANKTDKASMLDEIIDYVKFLRLQVKVLSLSRLGSAATVAPLVADKSSELLQQTASSSPTNEGARVMEQKVAKLMEEDMGTAMQYLQGKGLCLMPISLATAISTTTSKGGSGNVASAKPQ